MDPPTNTLRRTRSALESKTGKETPCVFSLCKRINTRRDITEATNNVSIFARSIYSMTVACCNRNVDCRGSILRFSEHGKNETLIALVATEAKSY